MLATAGLIERKARPVLEMGETQGFYPGEALGFAYLVVRNSAGRG